MWPTHYPCGPLNVQSAFVNGMGFLLRPKWREHLKKEFSYRVLAVMGPLLKFKGYYYLWDSLDGNSRLSA